jgi:ribosome-associated protein
MTGTPVRVGGWFIIPADELQWQFDTPGGPGGQHANKTATRVELRWDPTTSRVLGDDLRGRLLHGLGGRAEGGVVAVAVAETRSQWRNRALARRRLADLILGALHEDPERVPSRPTTASRRRRAESKRRRSELKRLRRTPDEEV